MDKRIKKEAIYKLVILILLTAAIFAVYRLAIKIPIIETGYFDIPLLEIMMPVYYITLTVFIAVYIIYNRGFARTSITMDMLPDQWSYEEKVEFIEDGRRRKKRSEWMLMPILGISFTLAFELLELYAFPWLETLLS